MRDLTGVTLALEDIYRDGVDDPHHYDDRYDHNDNDDHDHCDHHDDHDWDHDSPWPCTR